MLAFVAPGQGAQTAGMLAPWLDLPGARSLLEAASAATGLDLTELGTTASDAALRPTEVAQPIVVITSLVGATVLAGGDGPRLNAQAVAGHSVGEWAAAVISGALETTTAMRLVALRGRGMAAAAAAGRPSGMSAVLGGDEDSVLAAIASLGLHAANVNGAGQIVAAGDLEQLAALGASPPTGSRVRPLDVAAAFHTPLMAPAQNELEAATAGITARSPQAVFPGNADGTALTASTLLPHLVAQVSRPVRFDRCLQEFRRLGVTAVIELPPAGVLTALVKRQLPGVTTCALRTPADLATAAAIMAEHAGRVAVPA